MQKELPQEMIIFLKSEDKIPSTNFTTVSQLSNIATRAILAFHTMENGWIKYLCLIAPAIHEEPCYQIIILNKDGYTDVNYTLDDNNTYSMDKYYEAVDYYNFIQNVTYC